MPFSLSPSSNKFTETRRLTYAFTGVVAAGLIVMGLLLVHLLMKPAQSLGVELGANRITYAYVFVMTVGVFTIFGYMLGHRADQLLRLSIVDALTGLYNRRAFEQRLDEESQRARRYHTPLALLIIDLDGLKQVNDTCGHLVGDQTLRRAAHAIRAILRAGSDFAARWGGDEFAILAPNTMTPAASRLAERVLTQIQQQAHVHGATATASIGVAVLEADQHDAHNATWLMQAADAALYRAKSSGPNHFRVAQPTGKYDVSGNVDRRAPS
jgi:diguanylate cyclase (GGDEF)-like protein